MWMILSFNFLDDFILSLKMQFPCKYLEITFLKAIPFNSYSLAVRNLEVKSAKLEEKIRQADESHSDKVEKGLIKNLVIGYLTAPNNGKGQILKLISAVLEFDQAEADRAGVNKSQSGWLGGLLQQHSSASGKRKIQRVLLNCRF